MGVHRGVWGEEGSGVVDSSKSTTIL